MRTRKDLIVSALLSGQKNIHFGKTEILLSLFSIESRDYITEITEILGNLSDLLRKSDIKESLKFCIPVLHGLQNLIRPQSIPHIGIHETFSTGEMSYNPLQSGFRVVINVQEGKIKQDELWVKNGQLYYGKNLDARAQ